MFAVAALGCCRYRGAGRALAFHAVPVAVTLLRVLTRMLRDLPRADATSDLAQPVLLL